MSFSRATECLMTEGLQSPFFITTIGFVHPETRMAVGLGRAGGYNRFSRKCYASLPHMETNANCLTMSEHGLRRSCASGGRRERESGTTPQGKEDYKLSQLSSCGVNDQKVWQKRKNTHPLDRALTQSHVQTIATCPQPARTRPQPDRAGAFLGLEAFIPTTQETHHRAGLSSRNA